MTAVLFEITKLARASSFLFAFFVFLLALIGRSIRAAGSRVTLSIKETKTPIETRFPRWLKGGTSEKFMVRKPMAVVTLAKKTGCRFTLKLSFIASFLGVPELRRSKNVTSRCTQLATATVRIIVGAEMVTEVSG